MFWWSVTDDSITFIAQVLWWIIVFVLMFCHCNCQRLRLSVLVKLSQLLLWTRVRKAKKKNPSYNWNVILLRNLTNTNLTLTYIMRYCSSLTTNPGDKMNCCKQCLLARRIDCRSWPVDQQCRWDGNFYKALCLLKLMYQSKLNNFSGQPSV